MVPASVSAVAAPAPANNAADTPAVTTPGPNRSYRPDSRYIPMAVTLSLLVAMFTVGSVRYANFGRPQVVLDVLIDNSFLLVVAVGMTFVILTGGIDLSVGSVVALSTMIAAKTLQLGWPPYLSMAAVLATGTVLGLLMGLLIQTLTTTILTIGVPTEETLLVKALVVTAVCLLQSPSFRARLPRWRRREPAPGNDTLPLTDQERVPA